MATKGDISVVFSRSVPLLPEVVEKEIEQL